MSGHAELSPSAAERWMVCPGSVVLSQGMPEKSSVFAEEGTRAHDVAQSMLTGKAVRVDPEMLEHVLTYTDHVEALGGELLVEQRVTVDDAVYGTADAVVWLEDDAHLHVVDFKYGAGVAVEVVGNLQLRIYALAALLTFGYPATVVTATIVQPRRPHPDGVIRSVTYDVVDLLDFHADLAAAVRVVRDAQEHDEASLLEQGFLTPSEKGCRWCLAAPKCPAIKRRAQESAKQVFVKGEPYDAGELAQTLEFLPILEGWIKNVREFAYDEAERGKTIPAWKLVEKRPSRKWRDEEAAAQALYACGLEEADFTERKLVSPATAEKLLPKEQRGVLEELTIKESSGHTLVHESDKRPAIQVDAKSAFANS